MNQSMPTTNTPHMITLVLALFIVLFNFILLISSWVLVAITYATQIDTTVAIIAITGNIIVDNIILAVLYFKRIKPLLTL